MPSPNADEANAGQLFIVGRVRRAHGIRGEVVVEVMTESPDAVFAPGARLFLSDARGNQKGTREVEIATARDFNDGLLVQFAGILDRNAAELLRDRFVLIPEDEVEAPADDEVYVHDLVGLTVRDVRRGKDLGVITGYFEVPGGGNLLLELRATDGGHTQLLPYTLEFVQRVDLGERVVDVVVPDGLFE